MGLLNDNESQQIREIFKERLREPVTIVHFSQQLECMYCRETTQLLEEVSELSELITLEKYNLMTDREKAKQFNVDAVPAIVITDPDETVKLNYYGIPSGYEFQTLIEALSMVSVKDSGLTPESKEKIKIVEDPLQLSVFVTPTCPHCPHAAIGSLQIAYENRNITSRVYEVSEFPALGQKYAVSGVPKTVIGDLGELVGGYPADMMVNQIVELYKQSKE